MIGGRQGPDLGVETKSKKKKLERHFLDRGVWVHVGLLFTEHMSNAVFCDRLEV